MNGYFITVSVFFFQNGATKKCQHIEVHQWSHKKDLCPQKLIFIKLCLFPIFVHFFTICGSDNRLINHADLTVQKYDTSIDLCRNYTEVGKLKIMISSGQIMDRKRIGETMKADSVQSR